MIYQTFYADICYISFVSSKAGTFTIVKPLLTFQPHYLLNRVPSYAIDVLGILVLFIDVLGMLNSHRPYSNYTTITQIEIQIHVWLCFQRVSNIAKYDKTIDSTL